tara:strand:- start:428 stop:541 length:114 start_codon:yes stop_codon:yes gene_type:complete
MQLQTIYLQGKMAAVNELDSAEEVEESTFDSKSEVKE